jgi:hypothetical protein
MTDNDLIKLIVTILNAGFTAQGLTVTVRQSFQPTKQGIYNGAQVFFTNVSDIEYGYLKRKDVYDAALGYFVHTETQKYESTFQVNALCIQDPANINSLTAKDYASLASRIIKSDYSRSVLMASNVGILRVTAVRNPQFVDDKDRFEASPSFDFTLTYNRDLNFTVPVVESSEYNIARV